jgi:hypothetical protein
MPIPKPRTFTLVDAMALVAATAVGIAGTQHGWKYWSYAWFWNLDRGWTADAILRRFPTLLALGLPALLVFTATILALRLRHPRPTFRRLFFQPGTAACVAALLVVAVETAGHVVATLQFNYSRGYLDKYLEFVSTYSGFFGEFATIVLVRMPNPVGHAVMATWVILLLSGRWRSEPTWIDRAGRILGFAWLASALFVWLNLHFINEDLPGSLGTFR